MSNNSNNSSKSKSSDISVFKKFTFNAEIINFYNEYKDDIQDILEQIYQQLGSPKKNEFLFKNENIINKLKSNPITIEKYNLICKYDFKKVLLQKKNKTNCNLEI